jgi:hypothetical protein
MHGHLTALDLLRTQCILSRPPNEIPASGDDCHGGDDDPSARSHVFLVTI